jgi:hypothetical protein
LRTWTDLLIGKMRELSIRSASLLTTINQLVSRKCYQVSSRKGRPSISWLNHCLLIFETSPRGSLSEIRCKFRLRVLPDTFKEKVHFESDLLVFVQDHSWILSKGGW